ncbi:TPA: M48 family metallopeptidase [Legionella pneumophila]|uniref:M48 family metallopeptidase n=1 Tax=Legionella pneumophila TaxID=446 RepID=UPI00077CAF06|nr:SprT family zinc-dependent metalloprotease [Legionella pneumophila]AMQ26663.1 metal-dependent hydrolase [Legionella pneumophila subsp. pneumophila]MBN5929116.1 M48 family metallopeptidase [Legionella pneumophila]MDF1930757.1 SprT family zinc-dependent metalloprotease [Legionella pneumophila]PQM73059.1 M48 family peptidase [Legionella pneumophila]PYB42526.1 M48 family peptidase [Legionella pneumophila]
MSTDATYITFGIDKIPFELRPKSQKSNRITIKVKPDCQVIVFAPPSATHDEIIVAVNKRAKWVYNKLRIFRAQQEYITTRQYISGESHYYLGKKYLLKVIDDSKTKPEVKLVRGQLQIIAARNIEHRRQLLSDWYKQKAFEVFSKRLDQLLSTAPWIKERPSINLRAMRSRWGSCAVNGKITLNTHLIKAPIACIDYVILHELCHHSEHNHSDKFYRLLNQVSPNWKQVKQYLDKAANLYLMT